jgi:hypothetical protein
MDGRVIQFSSLIATATGLSRPLSFATFIGDRN